MKIIVLIVSFIVLTASNCISMDENISKSISHDKQGNVGILNRIDFGNSYIYGQTVKSGAVYLLQRKKSEIESMLEYRKDYRKEILEDFSINESSKKK